jgi:hypothetical protein
MRSISSSSTSILLVNRVSLDCFALPHEKTRQRSGRRSDGGVGEGKGSARRIADTGTDDRGEHRLRRLSAGSSRRCRHNGTQQSFLDKWGNAIFLAPMIFGGLVSVLAAAWKFLRTGETRNGGQALDVLYTLGNRIRNTEEATELVEIEREIDKVLQAQRARSAAGEGKCARRHHPERCRPSPAEPDPRSPDSLDRAAPRKNPGVRAR